MFREIEPLGGTARAAGNDRGLRHPDGSINFGAYREIARLARRAAIKSSVRGALSLIASMFAGKPAPAMKHHAT
jgi:hypothetical protein